MVGVRPTHRRQGLLVRMMEEQLADVAARSEPLAVLTASETAIYGRFGYGLATFSSFWSLRTEGTTFVRPSTAGGQFRLLDPATALTVVPPIYDAARKQRVGEVTRSAQWFEHTFGNRPDGKPRRSFTVVHESDDGHADGFARYRVKDDWPGGIAANTVEVDDLFALDPEVETGLWQFLVDIDLVATVRGINRPMDESVRWRLAAPRRLQVDQVTDHLWVRVVDPAVALGGAHVLLRRPSRRRAHGSVPPRQRGTLVDRGIRRRRRGAPHRRRCRSRAVGARARRALPRGCVRDHAATRRSDHRAGSGCDRAGRPLLRLHARAVVRHRFLATAYAPSTAALSCMIASMGPGSTSLSSAR